MIQMIKFLLLLALYILSILIMPDQSEANRLNFIMRWLHIDAIAYLFKLGLASDEKDHQFPEPSFKMFRPIPKYYNGENDRFKLFKNILICYRWQISVGILFTVMYSSLNLLLSQIIKEFMQVMHETNEQKRYINNVTQKFVIMQMLKMLFGIHMKRVFHELAIKVESTIAKKLIKKALILDRQCQKKIPETEIYQLQNVDLKLINNLFTILYLGIEIPYTIGVAIIWLFSLNIFLGFITLYWFIIIFLMQRALDDKMRKCNLTKLKLIDQRSKLNYEFMEKITLARINSCESLLVEKNNDFFLQENHDHMLFYRYSSLYDIAQLLLPIAVVVTSLMFDLNTKNPMKVEQLYLILSMLGICYRPMKEFRTFSIALSDGFHSLRRVTDYFELPQFSSKSNDLYMKSKAQPAFIVMAKGSKGVIEKNGLNFQIDVKLQIQIQAKDRVVILGRKGQGSTSFLSMIIGQISIKNGLLRVQGKIAYLSQEHFFLIDTLEQNLAFYNDKYDIGRMMEIFKSLNLNNELRLTRGLQEIIQNNKYNQNQLKLLSLARMLCTRADIYVLDNPFTGLNSDISSKIQKLLREEQSRGAIVIMSQKTMRYMTDNDKVIIMNLATTKEFGVYKEMIKNPRSYIDNFLKQNKKTHEPNVQQEQFRTIAHEFQYKVRKSITFSSLFAKPSESKILKQKIDFLAKTVAAYSNKVARDYFEKKQKLAEKSPENSFHYYFIKYLKTCRFSESIYILIIIIAVEVLHIFIHFYIGHEYEHRANAGLQSMKNLMFYEVVLTIGLAGLIYLEGEVSSYIAVIIGNKLYEQSLICLSHKPLKWYSKEYALRTADKFNHDYEQIFIAVHSVLTLYKNVIIVLVTAFLLGGNQKIVILAAFGVALLYFLLFKLFRKARSIIVKYFYFYKYQFVKVFNESVDGAELIKIYEVSYEVIEKAKQKYVLLASHKLAAHYVSYSQSLLCDFTSTLITALALELGTSVDVKQSQLAVVATSILLLLNLADVIKTIIETAVQIESFFKLNILPFMEVVSITQDEFLSSKQQYPEQPVNYDIFFDSCYLKDNEDDAIFQIYPIKLKIKQGQKVCIYDQDETLRYNLLYSMTKNLSVLYDRKNITRTVFIGGVPICNISSETLRSLIGVITYDNFFIAGPLRQNLKWRNKHFDEKEALMIANQIELGQELKKFKEEGLDVNLQEGNENFSLTLIKKIAVLKILIDKPKIVILHDTSPFIWKHQIVKLIEKYIPNCTIIKITNFLDVAYDMQRIIYTQKLNVIQDGLKEKLVKDKLSKIGEMLRSTDQSAYKYRNKVSVMPHNFKKKDQLNKSKQKQVKMLSSSKQI